MDILEEIVINKRREVAQQKEAVSLERLISLGDGRFNRPVRSMRRALAESPTGIIAEFKRRSPSKGWLFREAQVGEVVPGYEAGGASACSVLTDTNFFGGTMGDLAKARRLVQLPLLRKDFIIDEYQLYQARLLGADAVLLIAACLTQKECQHLIRVAKVLDLEILLEIHQESELDYVTDGVDMVGVNNRNLGTFHTDVNNSLRLSQKLSSSDLLMVSESGISDPQTVDELRSVGFRGFLIGENFMRNGDPGDNVKSFINRLS